MLQELAGGQFGRVEGGLPRRVCEAGSSGVQRSHGLSLSLGGNHEMLHLIVDWFLNALALWLVARIIPGIEVRDFGAALMATIVIAIVDFFVGPILKLLG